MLKVKKLILILMEIQKYVSIESGMIVGQTMLDIVEQILVQQPQEMLLSSK